MQILASILVNATGKSLFDFAVDKLFKPLGIESPRNYKLQDKQAYMNFIKNKNNGGWVVDPKGINTAGWGLALKPRDLLKFAQLYLNKGKWNGKQIVSSQWIKDSIRKRSYWNGLSYGYLWWLIENGECCGYAALGDGGNTIFISPEKDIVVVISSSFMPQAKNRIELIKNYIVSVL